MRKSPILLALIGAGVLLPLAACTANSTTPPTATPTHSASSPAAAAPADIADKCIDGFASVIADGKPISLPDGCATVSIVGSGSTITLGNVEKLLVEGTKNTIHASGVKEVIAIGSDNKVDYTGPAPTIDDKGQHNTVSTR